MSCVPIEVAPVNPRWGWLPSTAYDTQELASKLSAQPADQLSLLHQAAEVYMEASGLQGGRHAAALCECPGRLPSPFLPGTVAGWTAGWPFGRWLGGGSLQAACQSAWHSAGLLRRCPLRRSDGHPLLRRHWPPPAQSALPLPPLALCRQLGCCADGHRPVSACAAARGGVRVPDRGHIQVRAVLGSPAGQPPGVQQLVSAGPGGWGPGGTGRLATRPRCLAWPGATLRRRRATPHCKRRLHPFWQKRVCWQRRESAPCHAHARASGCGCAHAASCGAVHTRAAAAGASPATTRRHRARPRPQGPGASGLVGDAPRRRARRLPAPLAVQVQARAAAAARL